MPAVESKESNRPWHGLRVAVVIPCYRVREQILDVLSGLRRFPVADIIVVDDACPQGTGDHVQHHADDPRVQVLRHEANLGVGGAMKTGILHALEHGADIVVKLDGDAQMNPDLIPRFVEPILRGQADMTKGNRFFNPEDVRAMPGVRLFGNAILSFMTKLSTSYWKTFDPTNGYLALHRTAAGLLPLDKIANRYFFETDLLFRLGILRAVVVDVPMKASYGEEESNLRVGKQIVPFFLGHVRNFLQRIYFTYFLRDFSIASIELVLGLVLATFGFVFGVRTWIHSSATQAVASAGTVMLSALPLLGGLNLLLSFLAFDIGSVPSRPIQLDRDHDAGPDSSGSEGGS